MLLTTMLCTWETPKGVLKVLQPKCDYSNQDEDMSKLVDNNVEGSLSQTFRQKL